MPTYYYRIIIYLLRIGIPFISYNSFAIIISYTIFVCDYNLIEKSMSINSFNLYFDFIPALSWSINLPDFPEGR